MAGENLYVIYRGEAVDDGSMPVTELAPALLSFAAAVKAANHKLNPSEPDPQINITQPSHGSFVIDLLISSGVIDRAINFILVKQPPALVGLEGLSGLIATTISAIVWLRKRVTHVDERPDGSIKYTFLDGTTLELTGAAILLIRDPEYRTSLRNFVQPLRHEGIDSMTLGNRKRTTESVTVQRSEVDAFDLPPLPEVQINESSRTVALRLLNVAFADNNKWRVTEGDAPYFVTIADPRFLSEVGRGVQVFGANDILRCEVTTRQWQTSAGDLKTEHTVDRVLSHIPGERQLPLPYGDSRSE